MSLRKRIEQKAKDLTDKVNRSILGELELHCQHRIESVKSFIIQTSPRYPRYPQYRLLNTAMDITNLHKVNRNTL